MLPWLILAVVAVPLVVVGFAATRRTKAVAEHPPSEDAAVRARTADEFAEAEAYEAQWRDEHHEELERKRLP